ncbi:MAG: fg-gap repeat protein [Chitinophagaceae bacterium]|nr:fg-gap repeat protein [Chitinophagaceae bacterium]
MRRTFAKYPGSNLVQVLKCLAIFLISTLVNSCGKEKKGIVTFEVLDYNTTGLSFANVLRPTPSFNMFNYMYFYNGAGIGAGDFNNDGLIDLFFTANQGENKLFLNEGKLHFKDVTASANIFQNHGWSTGVSVVDINNDGLLDIYICQVGNFESLKGKNQLLVCKGIKKGIPYYEDEAARYGLDFSGFSTQAAFFDYDNDGDLDMFLLNHSVHQNGTFGPRKDFLGTYHPLSGDRLFRNDGIKFTDVTRESAINSSAISYGLGIVVSDINLDGWPDLYAGNDFHENDYLYINQKNGKFSEESSARIMHTSMYSMGVDAGDINNDGFPDIVSADMLPSDPYMIRRSMGEGDYDVYNYKISAGYNYQYARNNLQLNRRNGMFSEVGLYAGMFASDWSWSTLWMDFDNDGWKDLFISNGIPKRLNDIDYVSFISSKEIQEEFKQNKIEDKDMALVNKFPEIKLPNKFFHNGRNASFNDISVSVKGNLPTFSNGAIYADLDNDGDLDIVTNNIDEPVSLYENKTDHATNHFINLKLTGPAKNINALGSKVIVLAEGQINNYENYPVHGFQSSMQIPLHIGLANMKIDSAFIVWPDNTFQPLSLIKKDTLLSISYKENLPVFDYNSITGYDKNNGRAFTDITESTKLQYKHQENFFQEFTREPLIPHMVSTEGPALAIDDINGDGLEDVFIGASKTFKPAIFLQQPGGTYAKLNQPELDKDSSNEEVSACWADINNDKFPDLIIANGGNEYYGKDRHLIPCIYLNNGKGQLTKLKDAFANCYTNASCVCSYDFNKDGFIDLFIGGRSIPWEYGSIPQSYLLKNDGHGHFIDVASTIAKGLSFSGMVTDAKWYDIDKDGDKDLLVCYEWGGIDVFINNNGKFIKKELTDKKGWWNFLLPVDIDNDGDIDLIAGNLGLNSRLKASASEPVRLYYNDFDNNGKKEQVVTYYLQGEEIPFSNKDELQRQIPLIKKKYLYAENFAKASLKEIFTAEKLEKANILTANYFSNAILINDGKMNFQVQAMPWAAQLTSFRSAVIVNGNNDNLPDILLMGNYYENNIQLGRSDADFGTLMLNRGKGNFKTETLSGLTIKGQVRHIANTNIKNKEAFILAMNNDSLRILSFK